MNVLARITGPGLENAQFVKRIRESLRGNTALVLVMIYTLILSANVVLYVANQGGYQDTSGLGTHLFYILWAVQFVLTALVSYQTALWSIVAEKTSGCYPMLILTGMSPRRILLGELLASMAFSAGLVIVGLPIFGISFLLGGASFTEILLASLSCVGVSILAGCIGLAGSVMGQRSNLVGMLVQGFALSLIGIIVLVIYCIIIASWWTPKSLDLIQLYGKGFPGYLFILFLAGWIGGLLFLVSCRKFYDSFRRILPAFPYLLFSLLALGTLHAVTYRGPVAADDELVLPFNFFAMLLLLIGVAVSMGREEDPERETRFLHRVGEWVERLRVHLVLLILAVVWMNSVWTMPAGVPPGFPVRLGFFLFGILLSWIGLAEFCSGLHENRNIQMGLFVSMTIVLLIVIPVFFLLLFDLYRGWEPGMMSLWLTLLSASPVGLLRIFGEPGLPTGLRQAGSHAEFLNTWVTVMHLAILVGGVGLGAGARRLRKRSRPGEAGGTGK